MNDNVNKMNEALAALCEKYSVAARGTISMDDKGNWKLACSCGKETFLLPWRTERKFVELKKFLDDKTLEDLSTLRFCTVKTGGCLKQQIAREMDIAVYFTGAPVESVFAVCSAEKGAAANIIAKLANDVSVSIECSTKLPAGQEEIGRHELIASRGVASDQTVDTQTPHSSIYVYGENGEQRYTDTDTELFGFSYAEIWLIRAAFAALSDTKLFDEWNIAYYEMMKCAQAALDSEELKKVIIL